uniref:Uncharacterized protein n=1 Tax=Streptomyces sp. NBC_00119 TaxID=2975659 RepID=A0AAU1TVH9_9ACTN
MQQVRRVCDTSLNQEQVAYYHAVRRLHDLAQRVHAVARNGSADGSELVARLDEFAGLDRDRAEAWFSSWEHARQWREIVDRLRRTLPGPGSA